MATPIGDVEETQLGDFIPDTSVDSLIDSVAKEEERGDAPKESLDEALVAALACLSKRDVEVLRMRLGIGMRRHTLEEIGKQFDLTRERIRQIQVKALRKLRHPSRSEALRYFYED